MEKYLKIFIGINFLLLSGCEEEKLIPVECFMAKIIGPQYCTSGDNSNGYLIEVLDVEKEGNEIIYFDGTKYQNAVEVSNLPEEYKEKEKLIYIHYEKNEDIIIYACDAMNYTFDVPHISIINICDIRD